MNLDRSASFTPLPSKNCIFAVNVPALLEKSYREAQLYAIPVLLLAAAMGAIVYAFSGMMVVSVVFPMVISAAAWLPAT